MLRRNISFAYIRTYTNVVRVKNSHHQPSPLKPQASAISWLNTKPMFQRLTCLFPSPQLKCLTLWRRQQVSKHRFFVQPHWPWWWWQSKSLKQDLRFWRHYKHSKHQHLFTNCHGVTSKKIWIKLPKHWFLAQPYQPCLRRWSSSPKHWFLAQACHR